MGVKQIIIGIVVVIALGLVGQRACKQYRHYFPEAQPGSYEEQYEEDMGDTSAPGVPSATPKPDKPKGAFGV